MTSSNPTIAALLPPRECFSPSKAGALALYAHGIGVHGLFKNRVQVFGIDTQSPYQDCGFTPLIYRKRFWQSNGRRFLDSFLEKEDVHQADLIEVHNRAQFVPIIRRTFPNKKIILYLHNNPDSIKALKNAGDRQAIVDHCNAVAGCSDFVCHQLCEKLRRDQISKVSGFYHGVRVAPPHPKEHLILFSGRIVPEKGILELAQALTTLLPSYPDWRFVMIGAQRHGGGKSTDRYSQRVFEALDPIQHQVTMTGFIPYDEVLTWTARAAISVVPSVWEEPFGRVGAEAQMAGCALIASKRGGLAEIVAKAGIPLNQVTPDEIARHVKKLIIDEPYRQTVQKFCLEAGQRFTIEQTTAMCDALRQRVLAS